jgi:hypothetical protein
MPLKRFLSIWFGPEFHSTSWGLARCQREEFPSDLRVRPDKTLAERMSRSLSNDGKVHVFVAMAGRLIPAESVIYDFPMRRRESGSSWRW